MKLKKWQLWTIVGCSLLVAVGLIWWNLYANERTLITILLVIDFVILTFSLQMALAQTFKFKPKPKKYNTASFSLSLEELEGNLKKKNYSKRDISYGYVYMKILDKTAYKVTFINDVEKYLASESEKAQGNIKGLDKCTKLLGFEIFIDYNEKILERIQDYSFQGKNIYYEGFYLDSRDNTLIETNIIEISPEFVEVVNNLKEDLGVALNVDQE